LETFLFAAVSKSIASTLTYPFILAKTRMQVSERRNQSPILVLSKIIQDEGYSVLHFLFKLTTGSLQRSSRTNYKGILGTGVYSHV
jgi:hypothetical protein